MYSDLLDVLGGGQQGSGGNNNRGGAGGNNSDNDPHKHTALRFKAGKMDMELLENGNYQVSPDNRRGQIQLVWDRSSSTLQWEWYDRRAKTVVDSYLIGPPDAESTFERVSTGREQDRVFLWHRPQLTDDNDKFTMYWMQDLPLDDEQQQQREEEEKDGDEEGRMDDDTLVVKLNQFLTNPHEANPDAATTTSSNDNDATTAANANSSSTSANNTNAALDPEALLQVMQGGTSGTAAAATTTGAAPSGSQVDALSNILENLGMPQPTTTSAPTNTTTATETAGSATESSAAASTTTSAAAAAGGTGTLTLADLQGAMAGLATSTPPATPGQTSQGPPLAELVNTPGLIQSLLENEEVVQKLIPLLPEGQRTKQQLEENLQSPQMSQTLRSLTSAILPDEEGSLEGYHSVICNFQLDPQDGQDALTTQANPIQAFLDCLVKKVEREKKAVAEADKKEEDKEEDAMEES